MTTKARSCSKPSRYWRSLIRSRIFFVPRPCRPGDKTYTERYKLPSAGPRRSRRQQEKPRDRDRARPLLSRPSSRHRGACLAEHQASRARMHLRDPRPLRHTRAGAGVDRIEPSGNLRGSSPRPPCAGEAERSTAYQHEGPLPRPERNGYDRLVRTIEQPRLLLAHPRSPEPSPQGPAESRKRSMCSYIRHDRTGRALPGDRTAFRAQFGMHATAPAPRSGHVPAPRGIPLRRPTASTRAVKIDRRSDRLAAGG